MKEHRLLQVQDNIEEEKFIGANSPPRDGTIQKRTYEVSDTDFTRKHTRLVP